MRLTALSTVLAELGIRGLCRVLLGGSIQADIHLDGFSTLATLGYRPLVVRWADEGLPGGGNPGR